MGLAGPDSSGPNAASADTGRAEEEQEVDVWWGGYDPRALLPSFVLAVLLTVAVGIAALYLTRAHDLSPLAVRYGAYAALAIIWLVQLTRWAYCVLTKTYRLTNQRLIVEGTFLRSRFVSVPLSSITDVRVEQSAMERRLRVGRLRILSQNLRKPVKIEGAFQPGDLAIELRRLVQEVRTRETVNATS